MVKKTRRKSALRQAFVEGIILYALLAAGLVIGAKNIYQWQSPLLYVGGVLIFLVGVFQHSRLPKQEKIVYRLQMNGVGIWKNPNLFGGIGVPYLYRLYFTACLSLFLVMMVYIFFTKIIVDEYSAPLLSWLIGLSGACLGQFFFFERQYTGYTLISIPLSEFMIMGDGSKEFCNSLELMIYGPKESPENIQLAKKVFDPLFIELKQRFEISRQNKERQLQQQAELHDNNDLIQFATSHLLEQLH